MFKINQLKKNRKYYCINYLEIDADIPLKVLEVGRGDGKQFVVCEYFKYPYPSPYLMIIEDWLDEPRFDFVPAPTIREIC